MCKSYQRIDFQRQCLYLTEYLKQEHLLVASFQAQLPNRHFLWRRRFPYLLLDVVLVMSDYRQWLPLVLTVNVLTIIFPYIGVCKSFLVAFLLATINNTETLTFFKLKQT